MLWVASRADPASVVHRDHEAQQPAAVCSDLLPGHDAPTERATTRDATFSLSTRSSRGQYGNAL
jgi:hypothetical protein